MTSADLRGSAGSGQAVEPAKAAAADGPPAPARRRRSQSIVPLAILLSCAVIGLDQFLHTTPADLAATPLNQTLHWAVDVVLAIPFAAVALWAGGWLSGRLGIGLDRTSGVFAQACVTTLILAVLLVPAWFTHYAVDSLAPASIAPAAASGGHAAHAGHVHGGPPPIAASWVGSGVLYLLMSVPLGAAAVYVGQRVASTLSHRLAGESDRVVRAIVSVGTAALALAFAWFIAGVASQANGLVVYTNGLTAVHLQHLVHAHLSTVYGVVVQPPFGYQLASATQDALAGQAIGLPVAFAGLLWLTRHLRDHPTPPAPAG